MAHLHTDSLEKLLCSKCALYLSHFPVYYDSTKGSTCGRCEPFENSVENTVYEIAVANQRFPCRYNFNGCLENIFPKGIPRHERLCSFRKYQCPAIVSPQCDWCGTTKDLFEHFEAKHPMFILSDGHFELDFINSHQEIYVLPHGEELFLVNRATDSKTSTFYCTVLYQGSNPESEGCSYKLILENNNKSKKHVIEKKIKQTLEVNGDIIRSILDDPMSIVASIEIFHENVINDSPVEDTDVYPEINYELLRELECLVCLEYMVPPIHQCLTGHSICLKCKENLSECPNCKQEFKNTQNFVLAQIINHIVYPCKHDRCKFTGKAKTIKQHEASCIYGPFKCPLKDYLECKTEVIYTEIYNHVLKNHYENVLEMETVTIPFDTAEVGERDCYILRYGSKLFKLHYLHENDGILWAMQLIGPAEESANYYFEIDIIDLSGGTSRVYFKKKCSALTDKEEAFEFESDVVYVDMCQIEPLLSTELSYRVRLSKN